MHLEYDPHNNLTSYMDAQGGVTHYVYDARNNLTGADRRGGGHDALRLRRRGPRDLNHGPGRRHDALRLRRPGAAHCSDRHDRKCDDLRLRRPGAGDFDHVVCWHGLCATTLTEYNAAGQVVKTTRNYLAGQPQNYTTYQGGPGGVYYNLVTQYAYDAAGRQIAVTDILGK